jgi:hypothetical protein
MTHDLCCLPQHLHTPLDTLECFKSPIRRSVSDPCITIAVVGLGLPLSTIIAPCLPSRSHIHPLYADLLLAYSDRLQLTCLVASTCS